jgi:hypothetical protein
MTLTPGKVNFQPLGRTPQHCIQVAYPPLPMFVAVATDLSTLQFNRPFGVKVQDMP